MKIFLLTNLIFFAQAGVFAQQDTEPTADELRLHQVYQNYYVEPTSETEWSKALSKTGSQKYEVQKGDTLWEISEVLFADPNFWPKLWSLNSDTMSNPHEIAKGRTIQFIPGDGYEPPQVAVQKTKGDDPKVADSKVAGDAAPAAQEEDWWRSNIILEVPPPKKHSVVIRDPPDSFPTWEYLVPSASKMKADFTRNILGKPQHENPALANELVLSIQAPVGKVIKTFTESSLVSSNTQFVFVRFNQPPEGTKFLSYTVSQDVKTPAGEKSDFKEIRYEGDLEVLESVSSNDLIYRAQVKTAYSPVQVGSLLQVGSVPRYDLSSAPSKEFGKNIPIIGFPSQSQRYFGYSNGFVYLEGGVDDGLQPGQVFSVFKIPEVTVNNSKQALNKQKVGEIKILRAQGGVSTAVVVKSDEEILVGYTL